MRCLGFALVVAAAADAACISGSCPESADLELSAMLQTKSFSSRAEQELLDSFMADPQAAAERFVEASPEAQAGMLRSARKLPMQQLRELPEDLQVDVLMAARAHGSQLIQAHVESQESLDEAVQRKRRTVRSTWKNHFDAFGSQDLDKIMLDYTNASVLESYEFPAGSLVTATGTAEIRDFFENLFKQLSDTSGLTAPVLEVTRSPAQVYLVWTAPTSDVMSATDSFFFAEDNTILRQNIVWTQGSEPAAYSEATTSKTQRAKELVSMQQDYAKESVQAAWDNHFSAFGAQDVEAIMQDYTEKSQLRAFDHSSGILTTANGLAQIQTFFEDLFAKLSDTSGLTAPIVHVTDSPASKQVYLVWTCPTSGILSATDSFLFAADNKILRQNIVFTSM